MKRTTQTWAQYRLWHVRNPHGECPGCSRALVIWRRIKLCAHCHWSLEPRAWSKLTASPCLCCYCTPDGAAAVRGAPAAEQPEQGKQLL